MRTTRKQAVPVLLKTFAETRFLPLILSAVENGCQALGAEKSDTLRLVLSCEEIFTHLSTLLPSGTPFQLSLSSGFYFDQVEMTVPVEDLDLKALNLTASLSPDREGDLEDMGLLIAARSVDSLHVERGEDGEMIFRVIKERSYPEAASIPEIKPPADPDKLRVKDPTPEAVKLFVYQLIRHVPSNRFPEAFRLPGKMIDMLRSGIYGALVAQDETGAVGGGVVWQFLGPKMAECYGPYCFVAEQREKIIRELLDGVLGKIARTSVLGLINRYHPEEIPEGYFEELGTIQDFTEEGGGKAYPYLFRLMHEDLGSKVWAHPDIESFLRETYQRLVLPREILPVHDEGEHYPDHSVISVRFEHPAKRAFLSPLWTGRDMAENVARHVAALSAEKIVNLLFEVDLGISEQTLWIPALLAQNFSPKGVLPYAGKGDLLFLQYDATTA